MQHAQTRTEKSIGRAWSPILEQPLAENHRDGMKMFARADEMRLYLKSGGRMPSTPPTRFAAWHRGSGWDSRHHRRRPSGAQCATSDRARPQDEKLACRSQA